MSALCAGRNVSNRDINPAVDCVVLPERRTEALSCGEWNHRPFVATENLHTNRVVLLLQVSHAQLIA